MGYFWAKVAAIPDCRGLSGLRSETWGARFVLKGKSVAEVADAGEDHGDAEAVGGGDDLGVFD